MLTEAEAIKVGEFKYYEKLRSIISTWETEDMYLFNKVLQTMDCLIESEMVNYEK